MWNCFLALTQRPFFVMMLLTSSFKLAKELGKRTALLLSAVAAVPEPGFCYSVVHYDFTRKNKIWFYLKCTLDSQGSETWLKIVEGHT